MVVGCLAVATVPACRRPVNRSPAVSVARARFAEALGPVRPVEGRLLGLAYAPAVAPLPWHLPDHARRDAQALLLNAEKQRTPVTLADRAVIEIVAGNLERAATLLEAATRLVPSNAVPFSDLAAVQLARARRLDRASYLLRALIAADQAHALAPALPDPIYNRALALERLSLRGAAIAAWRDYLTRDAVSGWAVEARAHKEALARHDGREAGDRVQRLLEGAGSRGDWHAVRGLVARFPQYARELVEGQLLGRWGQQVRSGDRLAAGCTLALCRHVGAALVERNGEGMAEEAVAAIDVASAARGARLSSLARGHSLYSKGLSLYGRGDFSLARPLFLASRAQLASGGSPFAAWASYQLARCDYQHFSYSSTLVSLGRLLRGKHARHPALSGRSFWLAGLTHMVRGNPASALTEYRKALALFSELGEIVNLSRLHTLTGDALGYEGRTEEAWAHFQRALAIAQRVEDAPALESACSDAALVAARLGQSRAALYLRDEEVEAARRTEDPLRIAEALKGHAEMRAATGELQAAFSDVSEAWNHSQRVLDGTTRCSLQGDLLRIRGELDRRNNPRRAVSSFSQAIEIYRITAYHYLLAGVLRERGLTHLALGDQTAAAVDLAAALAEGELQREQIPDREERVAFFAQLHSTIDDLVELEVNRGDAAAAFRWVERDRARALLDWMKSLPPPDRPRSPRAAVPLTAAQVQASLPADLSVIELEVLRDRVLTWLVRKDVMQFRQAPLPPMTLQSIVSRLAHLQSDQASPESQSVLSALYDLIMRPLASDLPPNCRIVFVPDATLHGVPFAALFDSEKGRYLIESHPVSAAPSSTILVHHLRRRNKDGARTSPQVLAVADPSFDRALFPDLSRLPAARIELAQIGAAFPGSLLLSGEQATRQAFLNFAGRYQIVHVGAHALVDADSPLLSRLVLAPVRGDPHRGELYARDLLGTSFPRTSLVVLAACSTESGPWRPTEGITSLATVFLASGVPAVIGTLWRVDDGDAARLLTAFYRHLSQHLDAGAALQLAQLDLIREPGASRSPSWAAFEMIGVSENDGQARRRSQ
jgi:CHAT domain-containing protein